MTVRYVALGGLGEVGMNCAVFELEGQLLIVDCGVSFADDESFGVDQIVPDFTVLLERAEDIAGIVITHAHQDHIGALPHLLAELDVPVYLSPFSSALLDQQLRYGELDPSEVQRVIVNAGDRVQCGPFDLEFVHVTHSVRETMALLMRTPVGTIVHTADFKIDEAPQHEAPIDKARFMLAGDEGVRLLFSDSTNVERPGRTRPEREVQAGLLRAVKSAEGRVLVTLFSSNIDRMQALVDAAIATRRRLLLLGRSLQRTFGIARDLGLLRFDVDPVVDEAAAKRLDGSALLVALTGSQAQPQTALARMAFDNLGGYQIEPGDRVIFSARAIPGNEATIARLKDQIVRRGGELYDAPDVHCSGHAMRDEQAELLGWVRPQSFVPVHGDYRYLVAHAALARSLGCGDTRVLENGDVLEIGATTTRIVGKWATARVLMDGSPIGAEDGEAMRVRRRIARGGMLLLTVTLQRSTGSMVGDPRVENLGVADSEHVESWYPRLGRVVSEAVAGMTPRGRLDADKVAEAARAEVTKLVKRHTGRRTYVHATVQYI